jgi:hypothetical protein
MSWRAGGLAGCFVRVEPRREARKYATGLVSDLPRKNCWTLAEHAGARHHLLIRRSLSDHTDLAFCYCHVPTGLTVAETKHVFHLLARDGQPIGHHLRWSWWRRRHQARARRLHHRARFRRRAAGPRSSHEVPAPRYAGRRESAARSTRKRC